MSTIKLAAKNFNRINIRTTPLYLADINLFEAPHMLTFIIPLKCQAGIALQRSSKPEKLLMPQGSRINFFALETLTGFSLGLNCPNWNLPEKLTSPNPMGAAHLVLPLSSPLATPLSSYTIIGENKVMTHSSGLHGGTQVPSSSIEFWQLKHCSAVGPQQPIDVHCSWHVSLPEYLIQWTNVESFFVYAQLRSWESDLPFWK